MGGPLSATLTVLKDFGSQIARPGRRYVACNFLNKVAVVHPDIAPLTWDAIGNGMVALPGLPVGDTYRGVNAFQGFLMLWHGNVLKWSDQNDLTMWIPVSTTASSFVFALLQAFTLGAVDTESDYLYVDENPTGLQSGQFLRIDSDPTYTFFKVGTVLPATGQTGVASGFTQSVPAGATQDLFLQEYIPYVTDTRLVFGTSPTKILKVKAAAIQASATILVLAADFAVPGVGGAVTVTVTNTPSFSPGDYVSVGHAATPGQDIYLVQNVNAATNEVILQRVGVGASGATTHHAGDYIVGQSSVSVENEAATTATSAFRESILEKYGFTIIPQNLTGASAVGTVYPVGTQVLTVDANGAGEEVNTGSLINGPILHFDTLGDYGYLFKRRSIQSVQYTGVGNGTFFIRPEITDEGLVGDYSFVKVGQDQMFIWGNRGIYRFIGGNNLQPVGEQHYKKMAKELDLSRANQIIGYHNEKDFEIWFVYPRIDQFGVGALRIFVYNYLENSCTLDDYPAEFGSVTAIGRLDWNQDLTWQNTKGTWAAPLSFLPTTQWAEESADTNPAYGIMGIQLDAPPVSPAMTMQAARDLYYSAHPSTTPIYTDPLQFLAWFNAYWRTNGNWPAISVLQSTSPADAQIAQAFGYLAGSGIPMYFLAISAGSSGCGMAGLLCYDNEITSRIGDPVLCKYESVDHDGGDPLAYKYADTQWFSIQTKSKLSIAMPILVYIGSKANYDDDVVWSAPQVINVQGNKNYVTKTNVQASGRYFRIKIQAATPGLQFRISQCRILGRLGATY